MCLSIQIRVPAWNSSESAQLDAILILSDHSNMGWSPLLNILEKFLEPLPVRGEGRGGKAGKDGVTAEFSTTESQGFFMSLYICKIKASEWRT